MELCLKLPNEGDIPALLKLYARVDRRYLSDRLPNPYTEASARWWLDLIRREEGRGGVYRAILADGVLIGTISAERKEDVFRRDAEMGYLLDPGFQARGIMTRAVEAFCPLAFDRLDLLRLSALVYAPNAASRRVLEKNGFAQEGLLKQAVVKGDAVWDLCLYGKCRN